MDTIDVPRDILNIIAAFAVYEKPPKGEILNLVKCKYDGEWFTITVILYEKKLADISVSFKFMFKNENAADIIFDEQETIYYSKGRISIDKYYMTVRIRYLTESIDLVLSMSESTFRRMLIDAQEDFKKSPPLAAISRKSVLLLCLLLEKYRRPAKKVRNIGVTYTKWRNDSKHDHLELKLYAGDITLSVVIDVLTYRNKESRHYDSYIYKNRNEIKTIRGRGMIGIRDEDTRIFLYIGHKLYQRIKDARHDYREFVELDLS